MKIFEVQLRKPNHPTGKYRRDGELFQVRRKIFAERISETIAQDKNLKVSIIESAKDQEILESIGTAPFAESAKDQEILKSIGTAKPEKKPAAKTGGFFGLGKKPEDQDATMIITEE